MTSAECSDATFAEDSEILVSLGISPPPPDPGPGDPGYRCASPVCTTCRAPRLEWLRHPGYESQAKRRVSRSVPTRDWSER